MILTIDIGNTNIAIGGFRGEELAFEVRISTDASKTADEYASKILHTLSMHNVEQHTVKGAIIASVVPPLTSAIREAIRFIYGVEALVVAPGIKTGIAVRCDNPSSVGSDLICACVAAHHLYGSPSLIVDMGTATKLMIVNREGAFVGVSIMPGVQMGLKGLSSGTAQLPQVSLEAPPSVIGTNTADCMKSGAVFGNAAMIDGMIDRFNEAFGEELPVLATGGFAAAIMPHCKHSYTLDTGMVLKGLNILYHKNT
ncbi:MAG: type III pantothenate kinase [Clostridia bacterium]|nr:type III pantothenate kinase [Clostridia bacterium]